jgi:hypothetical protein
VQVNVVNNTGQPATVTEQPNGDILVQVGRVMAKAITTPGNPAAVALRQSHGTQIPLVSR